MAPTQYHQAHCYHQDDQWLSLLSTNVYIHIYKYKTISHNPLRHIMSLMSPTSPQLHHSFTIPLWSALPAGPLRCRAKTLQRAVASVTGRNAAISQKGAANRTDPPNLFGYETYKLPISDHDHLWWVALFIIVKWNHVLRFWLSYETAGRLISPKASYPIILASTVDWSFMIHESL